MTLVEKQQLFTRLIARFLNHIHDSGYEVTFGMAERSREEAERLGFPNSNHVRRLAIDLNLFKDGLYLDRSTDWNTLGSWWELQHPLCRWGGRFGDGNHFSFEHEHVE